tara:strand:+ start:928 stop:1458 length:531 start_codon:yes stop_codon:yes gene_type:complete
MKKISLITLISMAFMSCQTLTEKEINQDIQLTIIGYEFNEEREKLNIIAGDVAITDVYMDYIQAHNDKDLNKIFEMDTDDVIIKTANGVIFNGRDSHKKELDAWFKSSSPTWKVKWMVANTAQGKDGKNQNWLTTGVDVVQTLDENSVTSHHVVDVNFVGLKIKELNVYDRASEKK